MAATSPAMMVNSARFAPSFRRTLAFDESSKGPTGWIRSLWATDLLEGPLRWIIAVILAALLNIAPISIAPAPAAPTLLDLQTPEAVLRWISIYRPKPAPDGVPAAVKALSRL